MNHTVYIALGSNIGNRAAYLHAALDAMSSYSTVEETSHLYETIPMLVTDQPLFLNAVCRVSTSLSPYRAVTSTPTDRRLSRQDEIDPLRSARHRS